MNKKEQKIVDRQLDDIADKLLLDGWRCTYAITDGLYKRMLFRLRDKIDEKLKNTEEKCERC